MRDKYYHTVIFDLDGTLLDTLEDLADSVNEALRRMKLPERSLAEVRGFVGNGVGRLMELSVPGGRMNPGYEQAFSLFREHYSAHCNDKTKPYPRIPGLLARLKGAGIKMAVVSNKLDHAVQELNDRYFRDLIPVAIGEREGIRRKPYPDTVFEALRRLGAGVSGSVYVGDSEVDIATAAAAGMDCISVDWGFRTGEELAAAGAGIIIHDPMELLRFFAEGPQP